MDAQLRCAAEGTDGQQESREGWSTLRVKMRINFLDAAWEQRVAFSAWESDTCQWTSVSACVVWWPRGHAQSQREPCAVPVELLTLVESTCVCVGPSHPPSRPSSCPSSFNSNSSSWVRTLAYRDTPKVLTLHHRRIRGRKVEVRIRLS